MDADLYHAFGIDHTITDYGEKCGLWANAQRVTFKDAGAVLAGSSAAMHNGPLDEAFADAIAPLAEEVESLLERINYSRFVAGATRRRG